VRGVIDWLSREVVASTMPGLRSTNALHNRIRRDSVDGFREEKSAGATHNDTVVYATFALIQGFRPRGRIRTLDRPSSITIRAFASSRDSFFVKISITTFSRCVGVTSWVRI